MLIAVINVGKALGSTTVATGLAAGLASRPETSTAAVIEADPRGGDLSLLAGVDPAVGLLSLAATSTKNAANWQLLEAHSHKAAGVPGLRIIPTSIHTASLENQLQAFWVDVGPTLKSLDEPVVVDIGRYDGAAAAITPLWIADMIVAVCSGDAASLARAQAELSSEAFQDLNVVPVINGSPWSLDEIASTVGLQAWNVLEWNPRAANAIRSGHWKPLRRSLLCRQLSQLGEQLLPPTLTIGTRTQ